MPSSDEIRARIADVLMKSLGIDRDAITPSATLIEDLGAESIDFLDIVFRLEHEFGVKIPRGELFIEPIIQGDAKLVQDGRPTPEGLAALRSEMPYADLSSLDGVRRLDTVTDLFTVDLLVRYITWKLAGEGRPNGGERTMALVSPAPIPR